MSEFTTWITSQGISIQILLIVAFVPIIATLISLSRYFLGYQSFGIYAPMILSIAYSYTGLRYGLLITALVVLSSIVSYSFLRKIRMHYITRIAVNYSILSIIIVIGIVGIYNLPLGFENFNAISPLGLISIMALSDFFIKMYVKKSLSATIRTLIETLLISIIGWYLITSEELINYLLNHLWIIPLLLLLNIVIGQYKGLRLKDLFRFKSITDVSSHEDKKN